MESKNFKPNTPEQPYIKGNGNIYFEMNYKSKENNDDKVRIIGEKFVNKNRDKGKIL